MSVENCSHRETATLVGIRPLTMTRHRITLHAPEFVHRLSGDDTVNEGSTATFGCKVVGFPKPSLRWFKDDREIIDHPRIRVEMDEEGHCEVTLEAVNKGDEAVYRCEAENKEGRSSSTFYLTVKGKKRRIVKKPSNRRQVSHSPLIATIAEKIDEETFEETSPPLDEDPLLKSFYRQTTVNTRLEPPKFLGQWAFAIDEYKDSAEDSDDDETEQGFLICDVMTDNDDVIFTDESSTNHETTPHKNISSAIEKPTDGRLSQNVSNSLHKEENDSRMSTSLEINQKIEYKVISKEAQCLSSFNDVLLHACAISNTIIQESSSKSSCNQKKDKKNNGTSSKVFEKFFVDMAFLLSAYVFLCLYYDIGVVKFLLNVLFVYFVYYIIES